MRTAQNSGGNSIVLPPPFEQSDDEIARPVRHFSINRDIYRGPNYKEAQARQALIDPFFLARGSLWLDE